MQVAGARASTRFNTFPTLTTHYCKVHLYAAVPSPLSERGAAAYSILLAHSVRAVVYRVLSLCCTAETMILKRHQPALGAVNTWGSETPRM